MVGLALQKALSDHFHILIPSRHELDFTNRDAVVRYFQKSQPDFVYHLAAKVGGIAANIADPVGFFYENMQININTIHAAHITGVKKFLYLGSSCMYPKNFEILKEEDLLTGTLEKTNEGYAFSKLAGWLYCRYLRTQYNMNYKVIIPCNLYGENDCLDLNQAHLVPAIIRKLHKAKIKKTSHVEIWGDGNARREFMYVKDLIHALVKALDDYETLPHVMNVGLGYDYSVNEYYHIAAKVIGYQKDFKYDLNKPSGMQKKLVDISKAKAWGWEAKTSLSEGISNVYHYLLTQKILEV